MLQTGQEMLKQSRFGKPCPCKPDKLRENLWPRASNGSATLQGINAARVRYTTVQGEEARSCFRQMNRAVQQHQAGLIFHLFQFPLCDVAEKTDEEFAADSSQHKDEDTKCKYFTILHYLKFLLGNCVMKSFVRKIQRC